MAANPGRIGAGRGELRETRVADPHHAHFVVGHPRLMGHDLDGIVGVVIGGIAEQIEGAARATGSPHLEADRGEPRHPGHHRSDVGGGIGKEVRVTTVGARDPEGLRKQGRDRIGRPGHVVAGVLDDRGTRTGRAAGLVVGIADGGSQLDPVAHGDVVEALVHGLVGVERPVGRGIRPRCQHGELRGSLSGRLVDPVVAGPGGEAANDERAQRVGLTRIAGHGHRRSVPHEGDAITRMGTGQPCLVDRSPPLEGGSRAGAGRTRSYRTDRHQGPGAQHGHDDHCRRRKPAQPSDSHETPPGARRGMAPGFHRTSLDHVTSARMGVVRRRQTDTGRTDEVRAEVRRAQPANAQSANLGMTSLPISSMVSITASWGMR